MKERSNIQNIQDRMAQHNIPCYKGDRIFDFEIVGRHVVGNFWNMLNSCLVALGVCCVGN